MVSGTGVALNAVQPLSNDGRRSVSEFFFIE
ncbi:hypothetical protein EBAG_05153 [Escherichia coli T426]|nr:hypothetical protein EBAG_05153 [Escherichia coli T426]